MKTKIQIKSIFGDVLFELEKENNTVKDTLIEAVKTKVNLQGAYLRGADLREADLQGAYLQGAYLREAYLQGAYLQGAYLRGADLREAKNSELAQAYTVIVPEGEIVGWKLCEDNKLVKLLVPKEAKRSNATGRKCRAEYVQVLEIIDMKNKRKKPTEAKSKHNNDFVYKTGETVKCDKWEEDRFQECAGGIHFFITRLEAENYE